MLRTPGSARSAIHNAERNSTACACCAQHGKYHTADESRHTEADGEVSEAVGEQADCQTSDASCGVQDCELREDGRRQSVNARSLAVCCRLCVVDALPPNVSGTARKGQGEHTAYVTTTSSAPCVCTKTCT